MKFEFKTVFYEVAYVICVAFVISGACNLGWSGMLFAAPFIAWAVYLSLAMSETLKFAYITIGLFILLAAFHYTLPYNPIIFPILNDGEVILVEDQDGCDYNSLGKCVYNCKKSECVDTYKLRAGQTLSVSAIKVSNGDFSTNLYVKTNKGSFDYRNDSTYYFSKPIVIDGFLKLGNLMYYPYPTLFFEVLFSSR